MVGQLVGDGGGDDGDRGLGGGVGDLAWHRPQLLTGREEHDRARIPELVVVGEGLGEQDRSSRVHGPVTIQRVPIQCSDRAVGSGKGLVADQPVEVSELVDSCGDDLLGCAFLGQVRMQIPDVRAVNSVGANTAQHCVEVVGSPALVCIVRREVMAQDAGTVGRCPAGHGVSDPRSAAHARHHHGPPAQRQRIAGQPARRMLAHGASQSTSPHKITAWLVGGCTAFSLPAAIEVRYCDSIAHTSTATDFLPGMR